MYLIQIIHNQLIEMGIFWELIQQNEIQAQKTKSESLEERVVQLEEELTKTQDLLRKTLIALEEHIGEDIDGDGKLGS